MAELSPPSSSVEAHEPELPQPKVRQRQHSDQVLRSISSAEEIVAPGPSGETPPTPPATTRASTAISAAETDNEDEEETTVGRAALVVEEEPVPEQVPAPQRTPPPPPLSPLQPIDTEVTNIDITTTPATPEEESMPSIKTVPKRDGPKQQSSKPRPAPVPLPLPLRQVPDNLPSPSSLSRVLREEGVRSPGHPSINALPPSPPLTRRGTNNTRTSSSSRYGPQAVAVIERKGSPDKVVARPGTSSSNASLKDVSKLGKKLGRQPIDYLLPNGSLPNPVSTNFHPWQDPDSIEDSPDTDQPVSAVFGGLNTLLENYYSILSNGGSIAVANGYHSVARKLLEQVGGVFTRDLGVDGIGWHDILEYIRGGRTRPCLCVLPVKGLMSRRNIETTILSGGQDDDAASHLQPSIYITKELAQSVVAGVKQKSGKVEDWLEEVEKVLRRSQPPSVPTSPTTLSTVPEDGEVDEHGEIVVQIIEGILNQNQIYVFRSYLADNHLLASTKLALIRLYPQHTPAAITAPIIALYLLLHDELHPLLRAVSHLSDAEMELINSGRFDGFLDGASNAVPRDEEEELRTITNLDRNLLRVLEGLDDEIEELHNRALIVRRALKERQNGIAKKVKKRSMQQLVEGDIPIPLQLLGDVEEDENDQLLAPVEEWEGGKSILLGPDDSASNVTFNRRRRAERRMEKEKLKEKEEAEKKKAEKKARRIEEKDERDGSKGERRERRREKEGEEEDDATVLGDGKSMHKKERKEKKEKREKHCDKEGCDECSSVKRSRSGRREGEEGGKEDVKDDGKERKERKEGKEGKERKEGKEGKDKHKGQKESKDGEKDKKGGFIDATRRWVDKKITDKPSKSADKEDKKEKDRPATGGSSKSADREKERPPTSQSHRGDHGHRERDYREGYRETHREIKVVDVGSKQW